MFSLDDIKNLKKCPECGFKHDRKGQAYCHICHAEYQRVWRKKKRAELLKLRASSGEMKPRM